MNDDPFTGEKSKRKEPKASADSSKKERKNKSDVVLPLLQTLAFLIPIAVMIYFFATFNHELQQKTYATFALFFYIQFNLISLFINLPLAFHTDKIKNDRVRKLTRWCCGATFFLAILAIAFPAAYMPI